MKVISTETREEAWLKAVNHLKNNAAHKTEYNLIIEVTQPALSNDRTRIIRTSFDEFLQLKETMLIKKYINECDGKKYEIAQKMNFSRQTLRLKMNKYRI
jgi:DNA-binding NtrC family response regulator